MKRWLYFCLFLCSACTVFSGSLPIAQELPILDDVQMWQVREIDQNINSLLLIQPLENGRLRWLHSDILGAPIARKILDQNGWHNDGFLPPTKQSESLFTAILSIILEEKGQFHHAYPHLKRQNVGDCTVYLEQTKKWWEICPKSDLQWHVKTANGVHWHLKRLDQ